MKSISIQADCGRGKFVIEGVIETKDGGMLLHVIDGLRGDCT